MTLLYDVAHRVRQQETAGRAAEFNHLCALLLRSNESIDAARQIAENDSHPTPSSVRTVLKAAQSFSDISAAQGFRQLAAAFLDSLSWRGVFDRMLPDMIRVAFKTPLFAVTTSAVGSEVEEGRPKAISRLDSRPGRSLGILSLCRSKVTRSIRRLQLEIASTILRQDTTIFLWKNRICVL